MPHPIIRRLGHLGALPWPASPSGVGLLTWQPFLGTSSELLPRSSVFLAPCQPSPAVPQARSLWRWVSRCRGHHSLCCPWLPLRVLPVTAAHILSEGPAPPPRRSQPRGKKNRRPCLLPGSGSPTSRPCGLLLTLVKCLPPPHVRKQVGCPLPAAVSPSESLCWLPGSDWT
jgi:hypothetical protein